MVAQEASALFTYATQPPLLTWQGFAMVTVCSRAQALEWHGQECIELLS